MKHSVIKDRAATDWDAECIRRDFPLLHFGYDGMPLIYLDNAATTQKPQTVIDAISSYYATQNANVHRAVYRLGQSATERYEAVRGKLQRFLGAQHVSEIVFTRGATEAINLVAHSYGRSYVGQGDEVLISQMEHHSNIIPWQMLCKEVGATLRVAPFDDAGTLRLDDFKPLLNGRTKIVALVHVSNALGTVNPIAEMTALAHQVGAKVLIDGAQSAGHMPIDVTALDCDFFVCSGHKMLAPTGTGVLYGKQALLEAMPPYQTGGGMVHTLDFEEATFKDVPEKFEAGTPNIAGVIGLGAAIDYLDGLGMENVAAYERELCAYGTEKLGAVKGLRFVGTPAQRTATWSFNLGDMHPHDVAGKLDGDGIAVRAGHHCTRPVMQRFGIPASVRVSLALYNTRKEVDTICEALNKCQRKPHTGLSADGKILLDHAKNPRNFRRIDVPTCVSEGGNPLCGDAFTIYLTLKNDEIVDAAFQGMGCTISKASASLMTTAVQGKTPAEACALSAAFESFITSSPGTSSDFTPLGELQAMSDIQNYPVRAQCATFPWHAMVTALEKNQLG